MNTTRKIEYYVTVPGYGPMPAHNATELQWLFDKYMAGELPGDVEIELTVIDTEIETIDLDEFLNSLDTFETAVEAKRLLENS